jgi:Uma2 family endonuclease
VNFGNAAKLKRLATAPLLVSEAEYLRTSYRPDCDYVDGVVLERNLCQFDQARLQILVLMALQGRAPEWGVLVLPELRLKIRPRKYRIPDVMVLPAGVKHPPVIEQPPLLCVEIVSPDDRLNHLTERAADYASLGVPETWILDPETRKAYV